jgi:transposase-like protein
MLAIDIKTAWLWNHKFRKVMVLDDRTKLAWNVEVDEVFVWWKHEGLRWRWAIGKLRVVIAVEVNMNQRNKKWLFRWMWRVRMKVIPNCWEQSLTSFIEENIEPWSTLYTDGWRWYRNISKKGYVHIIETESIIDDEIIGIHTQEVTPNVHIIASLLKRWLLGTHQKYLTHDGYFQDYLEEYTFRFNRRKSSNQWKLFKTLIEQIMTHQPTTMNQLKKTKIS